MDKIDQFKPWIEKIKNFVQNKWVRLFVQLLILTLCLTYLINNLRNINSTQVKFNFNIYLAVLAWGITIITVFLGALGFYLTLRAMVIPVRWVEGINIHLQSNLAKYIPGYAWQLIGKAYLTGRTGASVKMVGFAMTIELVQLYLAGICITLFSLPMDIVSHWKIGEPIINLLPSIRVVSILIFFLFPIGVSWIVSKAKINNQEKGFNPIVFYGASMCMITAWVLFGYSFWLLGKALFPISIDQLQLFVFTLSTSFLIGLAIIIVPASIGVRESIMVWLLGPVVGEPQAVIIAALARITVTLSEVISALAFKFGRRGDDNPKVLVSEVNPDNRD